MHLDLTVKFSMKEKLQVHRYGCHKELVALAFQKLIWQLIHEQGNIHSQMSQDWEKGGRDLLVVKFSPGKLLKGLGCLMVMEKGTHMDANLCNIVIVYSAVVVVMMRIVHRQV